VFETPLTHASADDCHAVAEVIEELVNHDLHTYSLGILNKLFPVEEDGYVHDAHRDNLAGSGVGMAAAMKYLASLGFLSDEDLLSLGYHNTLRLLGEEAGSGAPQSSSQS